MLPRLSPRVRLQGLFIFVAAAVLFAASQISPGLLEAERGPQDALVSATAKPADPDLVLLALDEQSLTVAAAGLEPGEIAQSPALRLMAGGFPWSREVYALAIRQLVRAGARLIIFDLVFPSPREGDDALAAAIAAAKDKVILADHFDKVESVQGEKAWKFVPLIPALALAPAGFVNMEPSSDTVIRHFAPYADTDSMNGWGFGPERPRPALMVAAAGALGLPVPAPARPELLRFPYLQPGTIRKPPLYEIFVPALWQSNYRNGEYFRDKIVLVGPTATRLQDNHNTPFGVELPGPEIHLSILSALRQGSWLRTAPKWAFPAGLLVSCLTVFFLAVGRKNTAYFVGGCLLLAAGWVALFLAAFFLWGTFLPLVHPLAALALSGFAALATDVSLERRERSRMRSMLARYVSKDLVREIEDDRESFLNDIGGRRREVVVMFSDLKGFTSAAEKIEASQMVALLNEYFSDMVGAIFAHRGTLDKFLGDALMATWGCFGQDSPANYVKNALDAAQEMKRRLEALNLRRRAEGLPEWGCGIGITLGPAVFGNIGSPEKMDLTVIGDTVNLASRLEGLTRIYGCDVLVDEGAAALAAQALLEIDIVRVKGRAATARLFHPVPTIEGRWVRAFEEARAMYLKQAFAEARQAFAAVGKGPLFGLAACYQRRCETFQVRPPEPGWDGTWNFAEK